MRKVLTLLIICFTFLVNAQTDVNSNDEFITIKVKIDKSFAEHGQKEYFIVKTEEVCDGKRKNNSTVRFGNYSSIQQSYSQSKNKGFNFNKTYNYGSYKKSNKCFLKKNNKFYHNHHEIETDNIHNTRLFEFISEEGDTIILNEESNDHIFIANYSSKKQSYSQSKNNGFNFNKTYNYGSYKKSNKCFSKNKVKFYHNHHEIETDNIYNTRLFEFITKEGDAIILNEESNDHIFIANDLHFTDKKNMQFIRDDGKTIKIMLKTE